jgi:hypothetical protein
MRYYASAIEVSVTSILVVDSVWVCWISKELRNTVNEDFLCVLSGKSGGGSRDMCSSEWDWVWEVPAIKSRLSYARGQEWFCVILLYSTTEYLPLCKNKSGQKGFFFNNLLHLTWIATSLIVIKVGSIPAFHFGDRLSCLSNFINLLSLSRANTTLVSQLCHDHFFPHLSNSLFTNYPFILHCIVWTVCSTAK